MSVRAPAATVHPEVAYDLVLDHQALVMALDRHRPRSIGELAAAMGEPLASVAERLAELLAAGLVEDTGSGFVACGQTYELLRQEAGIDFLRDQVLPALTPLLVGDEPDGVLREVSGNIGPAGVPGLEQGLLAQFGETLASIQEPGAGQERWVATLLLFGTTSEPPRELGTAGERAIWRLQTASRERDEERARAAAPRSLIYQYRVLLDDAGWRRTLAAADSLISSMEASKGTTYFGITLAGLRRGARVAKEVRR